MAPEDWYTPAPEGMPPASAMPAARPAAFELRPLAFGEVLDRTFSVYRSRFWLFVGIGSVCALLQSLMNALQLLPLNTIPRVGTATPGTPGAPFSNLLLDHMAPGIIVGLVVLGLLFVFAYVITQAATIFAVGEVYLGRPTSIGESLRATIGKWYRYFAIGLWQSAAAVYIPVLVLIAGGILLSVNGAGLKVLGGVLIFLGIVGGAPLAIFLWLRNSLAVPASVIEGLPTRQSMRRSKVLSHGAKWKVFVVFLLMMALTYAVSFLQMPLIFFIAFTVSKGGRAVGSEIAMIAIGFIGRSVVQPVLMIAISLVYFDQRVRLEALDLVVLLEEETALKAEAALPSEPPTPMFQPETDPTAAQANDHPLS